MPSGIVAQHECESSLLLEHAVFLPRGERFTVIIS